MAQLHNTEEEEPMAQLNITLNQEEIQALLLEDQGEAFKKILQASLNKILQAESAEKLKAEPYERSAERTDSRNGSRDRDLNTRVGRITLQVPRHRNVPFKTLVFENYSRSEAALVAGMAEMVVNGVSTRKVSRVMETLCGTSFSKSAVSDVCKDLDKAVKEFRTRPLEGDYPFLTVDATYFKVRENSRVISKAFMIAYGTNIERLNKELKRRSKVIGVFPNEDSVLRLMGSVLMEHHDAIQAGRAVFSKESLVSLMNSDVPAKLIVIAEKQRHLRAA